MDVGKRTVLCLRRDGSNLSLQQPSSRMELKLVYRALRKISDWTVHGFFSEVYITGEENVPRDGPLIIASSHANEIIDIATLSITIPHGRHLSFWAKSTMFKNPVGGFILSSSGAIPVNRNPNVSSGKSGDSRQQSLFQSTTEALREEHVIGVFPEGSSYSLPGIAQVLPGAAWAGIEYAKATKGSGKGAIIVPVGIVYTDKSQYQSRVCITFGSPISVNNYMKDVWDAENVEAASKSAAKEIMTEVEKGMLDITINAPNWDVLYAFRATRQLLWDDERRIQLEDWLRVNKRTMSLFNSDASRDTALIERKSSLSRYLSLQAHTGITHSQMLSLFGRKQSTLPSRLILLLISAKSFFKLALHPSTLFFVPLLPIFTPAYLFGWLGAKVLATKGEEEGQAQYKGVLGGLGLGIGLGAASRFLWRNLARAYIESFGVSNRWIWATVTSCALAKIATTMHRLLVPGVFRRWTMFVESLLFLTSSLLPLSPPPKSYLEDRRFRYPPAPPDNPFIRKLESDMARHPLQDIRENELGWMGRMKVLRWLILPARAEASAALRAHLNELDKVEDSPWHDLKHEVGIRRP